jgi:hypothetical protein
LDDNANLAERIIEGSAQHLVAFDDREGHFHIELAPVLVLRAGERRAALKLKRPVRHRRVEAAPVRGAQMLRNDEIERLPQRLLGGKAEQRRRGRVEPPDRSRPVGENDRVGAVAMARDATERVERERQASLGRRGAKHLLA